MILAVFDHSPEYQTSVKSAGFLVRRRSSKQIFKMAAMYAMLDYQWEQLTLFLNTDTSSSFELLLDFKSAIFDLQVTSILPSKF